MNYKESLDFIEEANWKGSVLGLDRMRELLERLGNPQKKLKYIHVAGTNGKGSVCAMLSSILTEAGYTTGLCISPHLESYNERIQINGDNIPDQDFCDMADVVKDAMYNGNGLGVMEDIPTEFERVLAMSFLYFAKRKCDIVVMEVGLGGRLDGTNIIDSPVLTLITHLALDHTAFLGETIERIALEKGGIIKEGSTLLMYEQVPEAMDVIKGLCDVEEVPFHTTDFSSLKLKSMSLEGQSFEYKGKSYETSLIGAYQFNNAAMVVDAIELLNRNGYNIREDILLKGLKKAVWPGRFDVLSTEPLVIADGAHNPDGAKALAGSIREYIPDAEEKKNITFVMSVMQDKDYDVMIECVAPFAKRFIAVAPDYDRAVPPGELADIIKEVTALPVSCYGTVLEGVKKAIASCGEDESVVIFGSLYQLGEARKALKND